MLFEDMGAYTVAAASTFNGFQRPTIYYVMSGPTWLVTVRVCGPEKLVLLRIKYNVSLNLFSLY